MVALGSLGVRGVVLDVEGTTTPISFVFDVLFPYARTNLREFLATHGPSGLLREVDRLLREEHAADVARGDAPPPLPADVSSGNAVDLEPYVVWLMDRDRKSPGLKLLQGLIWQRGFADGTLRGELFPDVAPALDRWRSREIDVAIYSSGSVLAQRLIFGNTEAGDLTPRISQFFDATIGPKRSAASYRHIASELHVQPNELLFLSDVHAELSAARTAGFQALLCVRPGNPEPAREDETTIESFDYTDMPVYQYDSISKNPQPDVEHGVDGGHSGMLELAEGDKLHFLCDINNRSSVTLSFVNELMTGEMCITFGSITGDGSFGYPTRVQN